MKINTAGERALVDEPRLSQSVSLQVSGKSHQKLLTKLTQIFATAIDCQIIWEQVNRLSQNLHTLPAWNAICS